jgi:LmbE family N-acetylglucosaminyl deacetylase
MLRLAFDQVKRLLCVGAHSDDLEIGCGGTVRRILRASPDVEVWWHVLSAAGDRRAEAEASATEILQGARTFHLEICDSRESYFPEQWGAIKDVFENVIRRSEPDLVLTHWRDDRHQDHQVLSDLAWNTFRNQTILEFEIPKYDGDVGNPNVYVALDEDLCIEKVNGIMKHFGSQAGRHWFTEDLFFALMRLRGMECGPGARYAEAFYGRKLVV